LFYIIKFLINYKSKSDNFTDETNIIASIDLIDSLFKHFFQIYDMADYDKNTKHMEIIVNLCFTLFSK
jgi:hypothetical protein